ncbi:MAG TPA: acyl-CoA dehydrogenase family protein, partial [Aggregatilineales bacterium]|nr:acyl-CoA dehydrogenase family protein [Aggregatilineales bacterium]
MVLAPDKKVNLYSPFTPEHEMFRKSVRNFVEKEIVPHIEEWEEAEIAPLHELFKKMGNLGFLGLNYPEEFG